jgi:hypothetical protein
MQYTCLPAASARQLKRLSGCRNLKNPAGWLRPAVSLNRPEQQ